MGTLSKTARASVGAGEGQKKLVIKAWVFRRNAGKLQTKPYLSFYSQDAADNFMSNHSADEFHLVKWDERKANQR